MKFVQLVRKNYLTIILLLIIIAVYFAFRLPNLTYQPVFADEAIYIRWAQVMKAEPTLRFLPLSDGKTPLFMWIMMPVFKIFEDPLFAGRILAVFSGFGTLVGAFLLGTIFFNKRVGLFSAYLIALTPYIVFFDRIGLVDTLLACFTIWSLLFGLLLVRYQRIDLAILLGYFLGGGILTKTPGMFNIILIPVTALTMVLSSGKLRKLLKIAGLFIISILTALGIYNILRLGPGFSNLSSRNQDYVRNPVDLLKNPLDPFVPHLRDLIEWWPLLLGYPVIIFIALGIFFSIFKKNRYAIVISLFALIPLIIQMCLLRTFTARYMLFSIAPLLVVAAYGIDLLILNFKKYQSILTGVIILVFLIWPLIFVNKLFFDIENAPLPGNERRGYLEDWTAGYGLREIAQYLNEESKKGLIIVGTEGSFGTLPEGLQIYFDKNRQVVFKPGNSTVSASLRKEAEKLPTFYVVNEARHAKGTENIELIKRFPKAYPKDSQYTPDAMVLYRVYPEN